MNPSFSPLATSVSFVTFAAFALLSVACGSAPPPPPPPPPVLAAPPAAAATAAAQPAREQPPPPLESKSSPFPAVAKRTLANGLRVSVVESHALPVIEVRVVVHAGAGFGPPGVGEITAKMLREGGTRAHTSSEIVKRVETLGSSLDVSVGPDGARLSMGVVHGQLGEALDVLGEVVRTPRFDPAELTRLKAHLSDQAQDNARANGTWGALRILFQSFFPAGGPYALSGVLASEIAKVDGAQVRDFHKRLYVPSNVELVVAGDVAADDVAKAIDKAFGDWKGPTGLPPSPAFPPPTAPETTRVVIADRPKSVQSDVIFAELLPDRHAATWPTDRVALQVLGGGFVGRLFQDVREKRSLAYSASARPLELAHGAQPLFAYAGTQTGKTVEAVQAVVDDVAGMRTSPPTDDDVAVARRFQSDIFAVRMETIGSIADMVSQLRELGLADDYWDTYRAALRAVTTADVDAEAAKTFGIDHAIIIVAGDADVVAQPLARFGEVTIVDPEHDFRIVRTIPKTNLPLSPSLSK
jgi:zinc protease